MVNKKGRRKRSSKAPPALIAEESTRVSGASLSSHDLAQGPHLEQPPPPLQRPKKTASVPCRNFHQGHCRYGDLCIFQHAEAAIPQQATPSSSSSGLCAKRPSKTVKETRLSRHARPPVLPSDRPPNVGASMAYEGFDVISSLLVHGGDDKDEMSQRTIYGGFTDAEVYELSLQGIKPSDPEAWDALAVLKGWDYGDDNDDDDDDDFGGDGELEERIMNLGFADDFDDDDVYELSLQGIKPWDPEARAALVVLNGGGFF